MLEVAKRLGQALPPATSLFRRISEHEVERAVGGEDAPEQQHTCRLARTAWEAQSSSQIVQCAESGCSPNVALQFSTPGVDHRLDSSTRTATIDGGLRVSLRAGVNIGVNIAMNIVVKFPLISLPRLSTMRDLVSDLVR